ncbi:hypothetical protein TIFTF001_003658 [Ficus carica]|uniref:Uncharacterized protein n=1 Tax=Ficus carica TaxID=3494 RepID=A0AA87Z9Z2_FICCA|nr:hypothetical protein TIFTF001_003658 [Ficus carica]
MAAIHTNSLAQLSVLSSSESGFKPTKLALNKAKKENDGKSGGKKEDGEENGKEGRKE